MSIMKSREILMIKRKNIYFAAIVLNLGLAVANAAISNFEWAAFNVFIAAVCRVGYVTSEKEN